MKSVEFISAKYDELLIKHQYIEEMSNELVKENQLLKKQVFNLQNQSEKMCVNFNELPYKTKLYGTYMDQLRD